MRTTSMRIFISSVRRGLVVERDALPGLIMALGHTAVCFEDFSAQDAPSREACLREVLASDVYLLLLGPHYGHRFPETGQSATHDEWMAATAAGKTRLVYRKDGVEFDEDQQEFARLVEDYGSGVFRDAFTTPHELQTKVVAKLRELEQAGNPLAFTALSGPVAVTWRREFGPAARNSAGPALEVHVVPIGADPLPARLLTDLETALPGRIRDLAQLEHSRALATTRLDGAVVVTSGSGMRRTAQPQLLGVRVAADRQVSVWAGLPGDDLSAVLDPDALPAQIAGMLRLIGGLRIIDTANVAVAVGLDPMTMVAVGRLADMANGRTIASMSSEPLRLLPDEQVSCAALDVGAAEVGQSWSRAMVDAVTARR
jgi:hypothetical protein